MRTSRVDGVNPVPDLKAAECGLTLTVVTGQRQANGGITRQDLQTCARMKELTEGIQNHIGFMGSFRR